MTKEISFEQALHYREGRKIKTSLLNYVKWSFFKKNKKPFIVNWHHIVICDALEDVYWGRRKNIIFNLPPRYSKTEVIVKGFIEWCLLQDARSKFLHLTYSEDLALDNSTEIREDIKSEWYQSHCPIKFKKDSDSKKKWYTKEGGGVYATGTCGSITGFGAGEFDDEEQFEDKESALIDDWITKTQEKAQDIQFGGAIIIDDPIKPDDAHSETQRNKANARLNSTILSRRNSTNDTPIIIVMQRLHEDDMAGFCINGGTSEKFDVISLPAINEKGEALWSLKHTVEQLEALKKADAFMYASQYMQNPKPMNGGLFPMEAWGRLQTLPKDIDFTFQVWDCAQKPGVSNDYSVCATWKINSRGYYIVDVWRDKVTAPVLQMMAETLFAKHRPDAVIIEDKSAGSSLIQYLQASTAIPVIPWEPEGEKIQRIIRAVPMVVAGNVYLVGDGEWIPDFIDEHQRVPHSKYDDQADTTAMANDYIKSMENEAAPRLRRL